MGTGKQRNISLKPWIKDAVLALAEKERKSFPTVINDLLTIQLELEGFSEGSYIARLRGREDNQIPNFDQESPRSIGSA